MFKLKSFLPLIFSLLLIPLSQAQFQSAPYELILSSGHVIPDANIHQATALASPSAAEVVQGKYYRLLQFTAIPDKTVREQIARAGIELLDYIPNKAYFASIPVDFDLQRLAQLNVRAVLKIADDWKMSEAVALRNFDDWARTGNLVSLAVRFHKNIAYDYVQNYFAQEGYTILKAPGFINLLHLQVETPRIAALLDNPMINYIDQIGDPGEKESDRGRAIHRANMIDSDSPMGRQYDGTGVKVLVRDDGAVGPHIDFTGRLTEFSDDFSLFNDHGDQVAGVAVGAGNLDPQQKGMAAGADLYNKDYISDFLDETLDLHQIDGVLLTNSSYSNGCNRGYSTTTETVDLQVYENPSLMHVFSAGNSGTSNCDYGAGPNWGNITGGHKQGKNVIATGNLEQNVILRFTSSKGPAHDGRIKPDICAHGHDQWSTTPNNTYDEFGGTSAAAPGIMGVMAQLYQAYQELNPGEEPISALIKAILLNTANDLENKGPDFRTGWGHVNAYRAVKVLEDKRYLTGALDQNETDSYMIDVPADTRQVRFMLYWADPAATPNTTKALINNLDFAAVTPSADEVFPWILDPTPIAANLATPAIRGVDNLNNMEQVLIDNPEEGAYELVVNGTELPFGEKEYFITYEFIKNEVTVTYPNGGEAFIPGLAERIHWDVFEATAPFVIEYTTDGGSNWNLIDEVGADIRHYNWDVPDHLTGRAQVRVTTDGISDTSDFLFSIAPTPTSVRVDFACPDTLRLRWDEMSGAEFYDVFMLGDKYMDSVGTTALTYHDIFIPNIDETLWFAVRAKGADDFVSRRTFAISHESGVTSNCLLLNNASTINILNSSSPNACSIYEEPVQIRIQNRGSAPQNDIAVYYQLNNEPPVMEVLAGTLEPSEIAEYEFSDTIKLDVEGSYEIKAWVAIPNEQVFSDDTLSKTINLTLFSAPVSPEIIEDFESGVFPPQDWKLRNPDNDLTWESTATLQSNGMTGEVAVMRNPDYPISNQRDEIISIPLDLTGMTQPALSFDLAYALPQSGFTDQFQVRVFSDCGNQFEATLYESAGQEIATLEERINNFVPTSAEDWDNKLFDLSPFIGQTIIIKFIGICKRNNNLYLDNINVFEYQDAPIAAFNSSAIGVCVGETVEFTDESEVLAVDTYSWDFGSNASPATANTAGPHAVSWSAPGMYTVNLMVSNPFGQDTYSQDILVEASPTAAFSYEHLNNDGVITFTNTSTGGLSYLWDFGNGNISTEASPDHVYTEEGTYQVTLTISSEYCPEVSITQEVIVEIETSLNEVPTGFLARVHPNPNKGQFNLTIKDDTSRELQIELLDVLGKKIYGQSIVTNNGEYNYPVDIANLPAGVFFVNLAGEGWKKTMRMVVQ